MKIKKTSSLIVDAYQPHQKGEIKPANQQEEITSAVSLKKEIRLRKKVPPMLQSTLRQYSKSSVNHSRKAQDGQATGSFTNRLKNSLSRAEQLFKNITICQICDNEMPSRNKNKLKDIYLVNCKHKYQFCESCLHHYVIYKVNNFQEVSCPNEECKKTLDTEITFFKNLPQDIQKKYKKIHQFHKIASDPYSKLCPSQGCQGIIRVRGGPMEEILLCYTCKREFCSKCLLAKHEGQCEKQELIYFEKNLKYRQCKSCKMIIEKNQGCNHIKCKCGYDFCYVCGEAWHPSHYNNHELNEAYEEEITIFAPCLCCVTVGCLADQPNPQNREHPQNIGEQSCRKQTLKCLLNTYYRFIMVSALLLIGVSVILWYLIYTILYALIYYPIVFCCEQRDNMYQGCYMTVLLPYVMAKGLYAGFRDIFGAKLTSLWRTYTLRFQIGLNLIIQM